MRNLISILFIIHLSIFQLYAQDAGGLNGAADAGDSSGDIVTRTGDADGGDGGEGRNNKGLSQSKGRPVLDYLPKGVQDFNKIYPRLHFRFVTGDLLSAGFFDYSGLFADTINDETPLKTAVDRSTTVERHAGLATFITLAISGEHGINAVENKVNKRLGIEKTHKSIRHLKTIAGLNIFAGVYGLFTVDSVIRGKSREEILEMLASRDTFVLAASMHIAFLGADIVIKKPLDKVRHNLLLVQQIQKSPQALKVAQEYSNKKGLSFLQDLLANTSKVNKIRSHLTKAKITLSINPGMIPLIVGGSIVEKTTYYIFAKVWDNLIQDFVVQKLNEYDQEQLIEDFYHACSYAKDQGALFSDERVINAAKVINSNIQQIVQLKLSSLVDEQIQYAKKLTKLDYQLELYDSFFKLKSNQDRKSFIDKLLDTKGDDFKLNFAFVMNLFNSVYQNEGEADKFKQNYHNYIDGTKNEIPDHTGLNITAGLRAINRRNKASNTKKIDQSLESLITKLEDKSQEDILAPINKTLKEIEKKQAKIANKASKLYGMDKESIMNSQRKYGLIENNIKDEQPEPQSIYDLILLQKIYSQRLAELLVNKDRKREIDQIQEENELSLYIQARQWENIIQKQQ